ncbi:flagellar assembly protein FliW [Microbacterium candidum]|uniref:Flagellar assembly protein FliW n=1 Tax=Microbacterium candidum TaxID=3041922 RepID=A0ABT7MTT6_9MICO|nr:flagellar assembly protein FliW [Microbacterium sp. ASV49]MDL9977854.1 flagellar assembly protein FliW [Microbacterium sp. ASV49]
MSATATVTVLDVEFVSPPPGLHPYTSFRLSRIPGAEGLYALRSAGDEVRLFLLDPTSGVHGYEPQLPAGLRAEIGASDPRDAMVLVVANPSDDGVYLNLRAPVVVHRGTGRAVQVVLEDQGLPIRVQLGASEAR